MTPLITDFPRPFPGRIAHVIDRYRLVINRGSLDGVKVGDGFNVYGQSEEYIEDPETGEDLGVLEIPKGHGKVIHLQEKIATIYSTATKQEAGFGVLMTQATTRTVTAPFADPAVGDFVKGGIGVP